MDEEGDGGGRLVGIGHAFTGIGGFPLSEALLLLEAEAAFLTTF